MFTLFKLVLFSNAFSFVILHEFVIMHNFVMSRVEICEHGSLLVPLHCLQTEGGFLQVLEDSLGVTVCRKSGIDFMDEAFTLLSIM